MLVVVMGVVGERRRRRGDRHFFAGLGDWMMGRCAFCSSAAFLASAGNVLGIEGERARIRGLYHTYITLVFTDLTQNAVIAYITGD